MAKTLIEKIKDLKYFAGLRDLKVILVEFLQTVTALETNSVIIGNLTTQSEDLTSGTLIPGQLYNVTNLQIGDDFSNVGYVESNSYFVATGTTPINWSFGSSVTKLSYTNDVIFNDIDTNIDFEVILFEGSIFLKIVITNNKFLDLKLFASNTTFLILNDNELLIPLSDVRYKIEVYN